MGKEKHVLVFCPLYTPMAGGLPNHAEQFNAAMAARGYRISVFTPRLDANSPSHEQAGNVSIIRFPAWEIIPNYPLPRFWSPVFWRMWQALGRQRYTAVISRTRFFFTTPLAYVFSRRHQVRWMHIEHGSGPIHLQNRFVGHVAQGVDWLFSRLAFRHADILVAISRASALFMQRLATCAIHVIYRGMEKGLLESIAPNASIRQGREGKVFIAYVGRLVYGKGIQDLLRALVELGDAPYVCCFIGDGPQRRQFEADAGSLGLLGRVLFLGSRPWDETIAYMKAVDIVVNPSYTEGLPTCIVEAALCHKAIIAADVGGTGEIITGQGDGYLFPAHDRTALVKALSDLVHDSEARKNMGEKAFRHVARRFSWDEASTQYSQLL